MIDVSGISKVLDGEIDTSFLPVYVIAGFILVMGTYVGCYVIYQKSKVLLQPIRFLRKIICRFICALRA